MNYVAHTAAEAAQIQQRIYAHRGIGLLEVETVKIDPQGIRWYQILSKSFQENKVTMLRHVLLLIKYDVIYFPFGDLIIQYTPQDLRKVLLKFEESIWAVDEMDRNALILYIDLIRPRKLAA